MLASYSRTHASFLAALGLTTASVTLFLRYLWSLSLGNGDELFFSTGAGDFNVPQGTMKQWASFFSWLWWEHTGRTADWLSGAVYFFGDEEGRWIVSLLTALSAATITWCLYYLFHKLYRVSMGAWILGPISVLSMLFAYSTLSLTPLANLTMYSAAVCNYLVPASLIFFSITLATTSKGLASLYAASILGGLTATMHEQAAAVLAVLSLFFIVYGTPRFSLPHRIFTSAIVFVGVVEMFFAPGLHAKLNRVASVAPETPIPITQKLLTSFHGFGIYFPLLGLFMSAVIACYLFSFIQNQNNKRLPKLLLGLLAISTGGWAFSVFTHLLKLPFASVSSSGFACMVMMTVWLITPLLSPRPHIRWGAVLLIAAAASLAIPAAAGLSAVRVYNYPLIFFFAFFTWSGFNALNHLEENPSRSTRILTSVLFTALTLMTLWVIGHAFVAFQANYAPGVEDLERQESICQSNICPAVDPTLPYQSALSGYGEHDYASTDAVLEWLEK